MKIKFTALVAILCLISPFAANAALRTWDFEVTIDFGTGLPLGTVLSGNVSLDDTGLPLGPPGISQTGLLVDLSFSFDGTSYDHTTANTGFLQFNADGSLHALSFGTDCTAGGCGSGNPSTWFLIIGSFRIGDMGPDDFDFAGATANGEPVRGDMTFEERIGPENPDTLLEQLGIAVTGVGPGNSLADKIMLARTYLAVPDVDAACAMLNAFLNQVQAQRGKKLTVELADKLTADAEAIQAAIGCD